MAKLASLIMLLGLALCSCPKDSTGNSLIGLTESQATKKLGTPTSSATLVLSNSSRLYEYQSRLYGIMPKKEGESLEIRELQWKTFSKTTVVWLKMDEGGNWVVIDALVWPAWVSH